MACNIDEIKNNSLTQAKKVFIGNSTTFKEKPNNIIWMPIGKFSTSQLYEIARKNALKVGEWAANKFGNKFSDDWVYINQLKNGIEVLINFPKNLEEAYSLKIEKENREKEARQRALEANEYVNEEGDVTVKYQLAESELLQLKPISEQFDRDISELNQYNLRDLQREEKERKGEKVSEKDEEYFNNSRFSKSQVLNLGKPSSILQKIGMPDLPITTTSNWLLNHIIRNPEHNLKLLNLKGLVEAIHNPIAIFQDKEYKGQDGRIEILTTVKSRDGKPSNVIIQFNKQFGKLNVNSITTAFETDLFRFQKATRQNTVKYIDKERITDYLQGVLLPASQKNDAQKGILVYPKSISDSSTNIEKFLYYVNNFPDILSKSDKKYQQAIATGDETLLESTDNQSLTTGLEWLKQVLPNSNTQLVDGLIDKIGKGVYKEAEDLILASKQYADKGTIKHEAIHRILALLPENEREAILDEASKLFNISRGKSTATVKYSQAQQNEINYVLKSVDILSSDKAKQVFAKGEKANWSLDKILTELQIPKEQKQLILDLNKTNREEIITDLLANYSYTVEINTAVENKSQYAGENNFYIPEGEFYGDYTVVFKDLFSSEIEDYRRNGESISKEEYLKAQEYSKNLPLTNTQHYSHLTVPGGTNYTENEIATPNIIPNIKGHARFSTDNGIGWFRSDEQVNNGQIEDDLSDLDEGERYYAEQIAQDHLTNTKRTIGGILTKTRRILEVQSDLFQKGRERKDLISTNITEVNNLVQIKLERQINAINTNKPVEYKKGRNIYDDVYIDGVLIEDSKYTKGKFDKEKTLKYLEEEKLRNISDKQFSSENQFLQLLNKDNNWVTFFIKAIIQDSAKKGYEKVLFPTSEVVSKIQKFDEAAEKYSNAISKLEKDRTSEDNFIISEWEKDSTKKTIKGTLDFYNNLRNTLDDLVGGNKNDRKKGIYKLTQITDEYGNTWQEVEIKPEYLENIKFQTPKLEYTGDLAIEEKIAEMAEKSKDEKIAKTKLEKFIQDVKNFFRDLFKEKDTISRLIRDLNQGRFANLQRTNISKQIENNTFYQLVETEEHKIIEELKKTDQDKIVENVQDFSNAIKSRLSSILKNKNYERLKTILTSENGLNKWEALNTLLNDAAKSKTDFEDVEKNVNSLLRKARAIAVGIIQMDNMTDLIYEDVKTIVANKENALNNITTLQYHLYALKDFKIFLEEAEITFEGSKITTSKISDVLGKIKAIERYIIQNDTAGIVQAFKPYVSENIENFFTSNKQYQETGKIQQLKLEQEEKEEVIKFDESDLSYNRYKFLQKNPVSEDLFNTLTEEEKKVLIWQSNNC